MSTSYYMQLNRPTVCDAIKIGYSANGRFRFQIYDTLLPADIRESYDGRPVEFLQRLIESGEWVLLDEYDQITSLDELVERCRSRR